MLTTTGTPTLPPPLVAAALPDEAFHTTNNGYVIALAVTVSSCSNPVDVLAQVILPREYYKLERSSPLIPRIRKALVALAVDDPGVDFQFIRDGAHAAPKSRTWNTVFSNPYLEAATGTVETMRIDNWASEPPEFDARFTADWLVHRGYGSCWLRLPRLMGGLVPNLAINAAIVVDRKVGPISKATKTGSSGGSRSTITYRWPNGTKQTVTISNPTANDYVDGGVPASIGLVSLTSPLTVVSSDSEASAPELGQPTWSCAAPKGTNNASKFDAGFEPSGGFIYSTPPTLSEFQRSRTPDCSGIVALVEPGSQSRHDLWLLVIGAALSAGVAVLLDVVLKRRHEGHGAAVGDSP